MEEKINKMAIIDEKLLGAIIVILCVMVIGLLATNGNKEPDIVEMNCTARIPERIYWNQFSLTEFFAYQPVIDVETILFAGNGTAVFKKNGTNYAYQCTNLWIGQGAFCCKTWKVNFYKSGRIEFLEVIETYGSCHIETTELGYT